MALASCSTSGRSALERSRQPLACRAGRHRRLHVTSLLKPAEGLNVSWKQTTDEVFIKVPIADGVRGKQVAFEVHPKRLKLQVQGKPVLEGSLADAGEVDHDSSYWNIEDEGGERFIQITLAKRTMGFQSWEQLLEADKVDASITHRVTLDVSVGDDTKRLVLGLFGNAAPRTVENFRALCTGEKGTSPSGAELTFKGSPFHRIIPGFMAQGGDITLGNGMGGESIYGEKFEDENFRLKHEGRGYLAMANSGPNTNGSQFYLLFQPTPHLDGKHVVFGKLEAGHDGLAAMEEVGTTEGNTLKPVAITACQEVSLDTDPKQLVEEFRKQQAATKQQQKAEAEGVEADQLPATSRSKPGSPAPGAGSRTASPAPGDK